MEILCKSILVSLILFGGGQLTRGQSQRSNGRWSLDELSSITVLLVNEQKQHSGTGTVIRHGTKFFILTAKHVAIDLDMRSTVFIKMKDRNAGVFSMKSLVGEKLNVKSHPKADVSIIELSLHKPDIDNWFYENSLPTENIYHGEYGGNLDIGRERELSFLGYPYVDGSAPNRFMPMSFNCRFSSELQYYKLKVANILIDCDVLFLDRISIEGASGGGLYAGVSKNINFLDTGLTQLVGIISGNLTVEKKQVIAGSEQSIFESRLCFVMPTKYVWELLNEQQTDMK